MKLSKPVIDPSFRGYPKMSPRRIHGAIWGTLGPWLGAGTLLTAGRILARRQAAREGQAPIPPIIYEHLGNIGPTLMALGVLATGGIVWRLARTGGVSAKWPRPVLAGVVLADVGLGLNILAETVPELIVPTGIDYNTVASAGPGDLIAGASTSAAAGAALAFIMRPSDAERAIFAEVANRDSQPPEGTVLPGPAAPPFAQSLIQ